MGHLQIPYVMYENTYKLLAKKHIRSDTENINQLYSFLKISCKL